MKFIGKWKIAYITLGYINGLNIKHEYIILHVPIVEMCIEIFQYNPYIHHQTSTLHYVCWQRVLKSIWTFTKSVYKTEQTNKKKKSFDW